MTRGVNKVLTSITNFHTCATCHVNLLDAGILVMYCQLVKFACYVICSSRISISIVVHGVGSCGRRNCMSWIRLIVFFIHIPTFVGGITILETNLTLWSIRVAAAASLPRPPCRAFMPCSPRPPPGERPPCLEHPRPVLWSKPPQPPRLVKFADEPEPPLRYQHMTQR
jgi:hypothetical protein